MSLYMWLLNAGVIISLFIIVHTCNYLKQTFAIEIEKCIECHQTLSFCEEMAMPDYMYNVSSYLMWIELNVHLIHSVTIYMYHACIV